MNDSNNNSSSSGGGANTGFSPFIKNGKPNTTPRKKSQDQLMGTDSRPNWYGSPRSLPSPPFPSFFPSFSLPDLLCESTDAIWK